MTTRKVDLPYVDNARALLITVAINLGVVFLFNWPEGVTYRGVVWDSLFCAAITTAVDIWIVHAGLKKMRAAGQMPPQAPVSRLMQRLPRNPVALGAIYAAVFGVLTMGGNAAILWFFGIQSMTFAAWVLYKLMYATVLSVTITEYCIYRYAQPDWAGAGSVSAEAPRSVPADSVKNPLPKIGLFKEIYGSVTANIALNIIIGSALGGVVAGPGGTVVIFPTTVEGIPITGLIFGCIFGVLVTNGVMTAMNAIIIANPTMPEGAATDRRLTWMPKGRPALTCMASLCVMVFSAAVLPALMALFAVPVLNFYQFTGLITAYAAMIGKPLSFIVTRRCMQSDYIRHVLGARAS